MQPSSHTRRIALALATLGLGGCGLAKSLPHATDIGSIFSHKRSTTQRDTAPLNLTLGTYASCQALQDDVHSQLAIQAQNNQERDDWYARNPQPSNAVLATATAQADSAGGVANAPATATATAPTTATANTTTNVQVQGVDESDFIKVAAHHLYVYRSQGLEVVGRSDLHQIGRLALDDMQGVTL